MSPRHVDRQAENPTPPCHLSLDKLSALTGKELPTPGPRGLAREARKEQLELRPENMLIWEEGDVP